ncbi:MAG: PDGLE domain-containing protein [Caldisericia bacterium]
MKKIILYGFIITIVLVVLSPIASSFPDGLEKVSEIFNFSEKGINLINSPIADYSLRSIKNDSLSTILAGFIGVLTVFFLSFVVGYVIKRVKI